MREIFLMVITIKKPPKPKSESQSLVVCMLRLYFIYYATLYIMHVIKKYSKNTQNTKKFVFNGQVCPLKTK